MTVTRSILVLSVSLCVSLISMAARAQQPGAPALSEQGKIIPIPNATPAHLAAARDLVAATGLGSSIISVIPGLMSQINQTITRTRPELIPDLKATLDALAPEFGRLPEEMLNSAARVYTAVMNEQECKGALAFFQSPVGKKFIESQPTVIGNLNQMIQVWSQQMSVKMMDRVREEMKKKGHEI